MESIIKPEDLKSLSHQQLIIIISSSEREFLTVQPERTREELEQAILADLENGELDEIHVILELNS